LGEPSEAPAPLAAVRAAVCRPLVGAAILLAIYVVLSFVNDPRGYLGTDTGAKVATLEVMDRTGSAHPDVGYWAQDQDPSGHLHPIYDSIDVDGEWVQVTTLPMLEVGRPLYALGGYRLALLLPMLGAIGAAFAARSIARRSAGSEDAGWLAFWVVGLASPMVVYALDFWEHAPGVGLVLGAVALLGGVLDDERPVPRALLAGGLLGLAATMRTEAFVYALMAVGVLGLMLLVDGRQWKRAITVGVGSVAGFAVPWFANDALEHAVGGVDRAGRAGGAVGGGLGGIGDRAREAAITLFALRSAELSRMLVVGGFLALLVVGMVVSSRQGRADRMRILGAGALALYLVTAFAGLGFVPGLFAAAPVALVALTVRPRSPSGAYPLLVALCALPVVWAFQYLGGALPQWGGRYTLPSCLLLVALGAGVLAREARPLAVGVIALGLLVTVTGELWLRHRSEEVDRAFRVLVARPEDVVVARNAFFVREGGPAYLERLWLTAPGPGDVEDAAHVVSAKGLRTFLVVDETPTAPSRVGAARLTHTDRLAVLGSAIYLHSYDLG
jgi:hypothetical protein